jgi:Protein of unknown function (DUF4232)
VDAQDRFEDLVDEFAGVEGCVTVHLWRTATLAALAAACAAALVAGCSSSSSSPGTAASPTVPASSSTAPSTAPGSATSPQAAGPAPCATANLQVKLGVSQGAAGSIYQTIDFTDTGGASCTLYGYPGVSLAGGNPPAQIGAAAARSTQSSPKQVTLAPGAVANAVLQVTEAGNYPAATCDPVQASTLVIYPPNQTVSVSVPYKATGCSAKQVVILHVSVVQAGSGG